MVATNEQAQAFKGTLETDDIPDFTIKVDSYQWRVHSSLLSKQSKFFKNVCQSNFKEAMEREVTLHDECPWMVARMIQYFYFGRYDHSHRGSICPEKHKCEIEGGTHCIISLNKMMKVDEPDEDLQDLRIIDQKKSCLEIAAEMYKLADKYGIITLRSLARGELEISKYCSEKDFLLVADIIGPDAIHREQVLLRNMIAGICSDYMENPGEYLSLEELFGTDQYVSMAMIQYLSNKVKEAERTKTARCEYLESIISAKDDELGDVQAQLHAALTFEYPDYLGHAEN